MNNTVSNVENQVKKEYFILHHGQEMELKPGTYNYDYGMDVNDENISKYNNKTYYNYNKGKYIGETVGTFEPKNQENYMSVENVEEYAISENYNICPREYKEISIIPDKFNDLKKQGYNIKIHSIDLDNDGKEEKVVCLTNTIGGKAYSEISLYNSDYEEITKLVTIEDGFVADLSKSGKIENAALLSLDLVDYIDVDIDGTIEIIVNHLCYEGSSISIYKYENETVNGPTNGKGYFGA